MELMLQIATIAGPIIGAIAIGVALWISGRSSKDAQKQIDEIHNLLEVVVASQTPVMLDALQQYKQQLYQLDEQIDDTKFHLSCLKNDFRRMSGVGIDRIEVAEEEKQISANLQELKSKRAQVNRQVQLIEAYLKKS